MFGLSLVNKCLFVASHREEKIDYYFSGTLAVFPAMILLFGGGAGILMSKGGTPIATAEWAKS